MANSNPSYKIMIIEAIVSQDSHHGATVETIGAFLQENYPVTSGSRFDAALQSALKSGINTGIFVFDESSKLFNLKKDDEKAQTRKRKRKRKSRAKRAKRTSKRRAKQLRGDQNPKTFHFKFHFNITVDGNDDNPKNFHFQHSVIKDIANLSDEDAKETEAVHLNLEFNGTHDEVDGVINDDAQNEQHNLDPLPVIEKLSDNYLDESSSGYKDKATARASKQEIEIRLLENDTDSSTESAVQVENPDLSGEDGARSNEIVTDVQDLIKGQRERYQHVYRMRLERVYRKYNPDRLKNGFVDKLLRNYGEEVDQIHSLYQKVCAKYEVIPHGKNSGQMETDIEVDEVPIGVDESTKDGNNVVDNGSACPVNRNVQNFAEDESSPDYDCRRDDPACKQM